MRPKVEAATILAGRYRLLRKVGQGGLATVWEAEHVTLASPVAVKFLLRTGPRDGELSQRFLREARIAASVKHRNVLDILDFGFTDIQLGDDTQVENEPVPYMVMELLHGRTLSALLEVEKRLSLARAIDIVAGTLRGLAAVHDAGLVHRDIKPENVFLVEDEDGAFPKLVDFGLSRRAGRGDAAEAGMLLGTPQYMSPEQAAGSADLDARTDIYAMGVVLYEVLGGQPPFARGSIPEMIDHVIHDAPTPLAQLAPHVSASVVAVVETAMAKDRERRFVDARAMRAALLAASPTALAEPPSTPKLPRVDAHARTLPATPAVVLPKELLTPPVVAARPSAPDPAEEIDDAPPRRQAARESPWIVAVRVLVLAATTLGVAVLVLDGAGAPSATVPAAPLEAPDAGELSLAIAPSAIDAASVLTEDASSAPDSGLVDAGGLDAGWDGGALDAGADAGLFDAGEANDAATLDAYVDPEDAGVDADEDAASEEAIDAGESAALEADRDAGRTVRRATPRRDPPRRARPTRRRAPARHPPRRRR